jgi:protease YdgD
MLSASAQADSLRPLTLRQDLLGWEGVGRLELGPGGYCTAALVAPDLVLTAAHCLFDGDTPRRREDLLFRAGHRNGETVAARGVVQGAVAADYRPSDPDRAARIAADVALLRLDAAIPAGTARPFLVDPSPAAGSVSVLSYGAGRDAVLSREAGCRVLGRRDLILAFDCSVTFGSSGAPVFRVDGTSIRIVSIISSGSGEDSLAFGPVLRGRVEALSAALRGGAGLWEVDRPAARHVGTASDRAAGGARFLRP